MTDSTKITDRFAPEDKPCPYHDGELLMVTRGEFRGEVVRVNGPASFYNATVGYYMGDPEQGVCSPVGWNIVIQRNTAHGSLALSDGGWMDLLREHEDVIARMTRRM